MFDAADAVVVPGLDDLTVGASDAENLADHSSLEVESIRGDQDGAGNSTAMHGVARQ